MDNDHVQDEYHRFPFRKDNRKLSLNKFHSVEPRNIASTIKDAEKRISSLNQDRLRIADKLQQRMLDRDLADRIGHLSIKRNDRVRVMILRRKWEAESLHSGINYRARNAPNEQKNDPGVKNMLYRIKDGKCNLATERKILEKIKQAEAEIAEIEKTNAEIITKPDQWRGDNSSEAVLLKSRLKIVTSDLEWLKREDAVYKFNSTTEVLDSNTAETEVAKLQRELEKIIKREDEMQTAERRLLGGIKEAAAEADKIIAGYITQPFGWRLKSEEAVMENRFKIISSDLAWLSIDSNAHIFNSTRPQEAMDSNKAECEIAKLQRELDNINRNKDELSTYILQLKNQSDEIV